MTLGFPRGLADKVSTCNVGDLGLIPGLGRSLGEGTSYPPECQNSSILDCTVHGSWSNPLSLTQRVGHD